MPSNSNFPQNKQNFFLLHPNYRITGYLILAVGMITGFYDFVLKNGIQLAGSTNNPQPLSIAISITFIIGLACIAGSRQKVEDEFTNLNRLKALRIAFLAAILFVVLLPLVNLLQDVPITGFSATRLLIGMLVIYLLAFTIINKQFPQ